MGHRIARRLFAPLLRFRRRPRRPPSQVAQPVAVATAPPVLGIGIGSCGMPWVMVKAAR